MTIDEMKNNDYTKDLKKLSKKSLVTYLNNIYKILENRDWNDDTTTVGMIIAEGGYCDFSKE